MIKKMTFLKYPFFFFEFFNLIKCLELLNHQSIIGELEAVHARNYARSPHFFYSQRPAYGFAYVMELKVDNTVADILRNAVLCQQV